MSLLPSGESLILCVCSVTGHVRVTLEAPVFMTTADTIAAWFGFHDEEVMDALPSAHISLKSPRSFWISTLS